MGEVTCVGGGDALGQHAVCDDVEDAESKDHGCDSEAELEHGLHVGLQKHRNKENQEVQIITSAAREKVY